jgi:hypothetical protein
MCSLGNARVTRGSNIRPEPLAPREKREHAPTETSPPDIPEKRRIEHARPGFNRPGIAVPVVHRFARTPAAARGPAVGNLS